MFDVLGRYAWYLFCLLAVVVGLGLTVIRDRDHPHWLLGPGAIGGGVVGFMLVFLLYRALDRSQARTRFLQTHGIAGRGSVTAVQKTSRWEGNDFRYLKLALTVEVPGRAPYPVTVSNPYHRKYIDLVKPGAVVPLLVHPTDPTQVMIPPDSLKPI